jgi:ribonuclease HI
VAAVWQRDSGALEVRGPDVARQVPPEKNKDLWIEINRERSRLLSRLIHFEWVKGHADDPYNEMADELANTAAGSSTGHGAKPRTT